MRITELQSNYVQFEFSGRKLAHRLTFAHIKRTIKVLSGTYSENPLSISPLLPRKTKLMIAKELAEPTIHDNTTCELLIEV